MIKNFDRTSPVLPIFTVYHSHALSTSNLKKSQGKEYAVVNVLIYLL